MANVQVIESPEIRTKRRCATVMDVFVGCELTRNDLPDDDGNVTGELINVKRVLGRAKKIIAYMIYEYDPKRGWVDEFHIMYPKAEPLVVLAVQQFHEQGIQRLAPYMPEVQAVAHYRTEKSEADKVIKEIESVPSGRVNALLDYMESFDEDSEYLRDKN